ncbi:MAG TPA: endonuclease III [bacterium]|nr:endonuclease III [bacterium]
MLCPYCDKEILNESVKCKYCKKNIDIEKCNQDAASNIIEVLKKNYKPVCALNFKTKFELLAAVILSAQCSDERVNLISKSLFKKYKAINDYAKADISEFELDIKSTGFYKNKAKSIIGCAKILIEKFNGEIPKDINELVKLPGVGRKTANVVLGTGFGITSGIVVDTHVKRLSNRIGLSSNADPEKIETELARIIPKSEWIDFSHLLILHGRKICKARKPECQGCKIEKWCAKKI